MADGEVVLVAVVDGEGVSREGAVEGLVEEDAVEEGRARGVERRALQDEAARAEDYVLAAEDEARTLAGDAAQFKVGVVEREFVRPREGVGAVGSFILPIRRNNRRNTRSYHRNYVRL